MGVPFCEQVSWDDRKGIFSDDFGEYPATHFLLHEHRTLIVTRFGKNVCMRFFLKIEFDVWLISSAIELNRVQVLGWLHASLWRYGDLFVIVPNPQSLRNYGLKALLCTPRVWRFYTLRVNQKSIKWPWAGTFEMNVKIEQGLNFVIQNDSQLFFEAQEA